MTPQEASKRAAEICALAPVIPVLVLDDLAHAKPLAEALVKGGLPVLEVTLRTPGALACIRALGAIDGAIVGAGTVLDPFHLQAAVEAGSQFLVSPGTGPKRWQRPGGSWKAAWRPRRSWRG